MTVTIHHGDALAVLRSLPGESVHCVVTSPPYWGLRDYGVEGQIGLERCLGEHLDCLVDVFREVRRVLRNDGTCWINYGDAYACAPNGRSAAATKALAQDDRTFRDKPISTVGAVYIREYEKTSRVGKTENMGNVASAHGGRVVGVGATLKPKDRMLLPARVAIALQDDGWWVRDEIVWHKPNPMPSSVKDRTTPAHEMIYMLSKSPRYWFDAEAYAEPIAEASKKRYAQKSIGTQKGGPRQDAWESGEAGQVKSRRPNEIVQALAKKHNNYDEKLIAGEKWGARHAGWDEIAADATMRNRRSVWRVPTKPCPEAHFATFPPALIEPCIKAGCPAGGVVLDPFFGAGTTGLVCQQLGRDCIGIELNPDYIFIAKKRLGLLTIEDLCA